MGMDGSTERAGFIRGTFYNHQPEPHHLHLDARLKRSSFPALWWFGICQRVPLQAERLQQSELDAELRGVGGGRQRVPARVGAPRRHQDPNTEPQLRKSRERLQDRGQHDEE